MSAFVIAVIIICHTQSNVCTKFEDELGPSKTVEECKARLEEMTDGALSLYRKYGPPGPSMIYRRCDPYFKGKSYPA